MPVLNILGYDVSFPFQPYKVQIDYMRTVLETLDDPTRPSHALLESPTGTGKTLCLLCAVLAWHVKDKALTGGRVAPELPSFFPLRGDTEVDPKNPKDKDSGKKKTRTIVYASRTHSQLAQVVREFKSTDYSRMCRMSVLGSREHLCVNHDVTRLPTSTAQNAMCNALRARRGCGYFMNVSRRVRDEEEMVAAYERTHDGVRFGDASYASRTDAPSAPGLHDIEDLMKEGRENRFCPYFYEREISNNADIVFLPYTYVTEPSLSRQLPFLLSNCVLIIDEAHNVPSLLSNATSRNLTPLETANAITDCTRGYTMAMQRAAEAAGGDGAVGDEVTLLDDAEGVAALKSILCNLEKEILSYRASSDTVVETGSMMVPFLAKARIDSGTLQAIRKAALTATQLLSQSDTPARGLGAFTDFLDRVFDPAIPAHAVDESFKFVIFPTQDRGAEARGLAPAAAATGQKPRTLGYWCLDTSIAVEAILREVPCLLLTSGTLSPMPHFAAELGLPFRHILQGEHVIDDHQLLAAVVRAGPSGDALNSKFVYRSSMEYSENLGNSISSLIRNSPDGGVVFFPSYGAMNAALEHWKLPQASTAATSAVAAAAPAPSAGAASAKSIWGIMADVKTLFVEPTDSSELPMTVKMFQSAVDEHRDNKGALFFAVCRGKVSEGVDFADRHGRIVIVTGIPFANTSDLAVKLKKQYITDMAPKRPTIDGKFYTGEDWYKTEAMRAVNQCIGRVIRHRHDFGAIILADERFESLAGSLSPWVRTRVTVYDRFVDCYRGIAQFFNYHNCGPLSKRQAPTTTTSHSDQADGHGATAQGATAAQPLPSSAGAARLFAASHTSTPVTISDEVKIGVVSPASSTGFKAPNAIGLAKMELLKTPIAIATGGSLYGVVPPAPSPAPAATAPAAAAAGKTSGASPAAQFCDEVKGLVTPDAYTEFRSALANCIKLMKVHQTDKAALMRAFATEVERVDRIFASARSGTDSASLMKRFGSFLPEALRGDFDRLATAAATKRRSPQVLSAPQPKRPQPRPENP